MAPACYLEYLQFLFQKSLETLSRYDKGGHLFLPSYMMRTHGSRKQQDAVKDVPAKQMQKVFEVQIFEVLIVAYLHIFLVAIGRGQIWGIAFIG